MIYFIFFNLFFGMGYIIWLIEYFLNCINDFFLYLSNLKVKSYEINFEFYFVSILEIKVEVC